MLQSQIIRQNISNIVIINKATWNKKELKEMKLEDWSSTILGNLILIQADTLDNILRNSHLHKVDFLKIDIEGAEIETLEGAKYILRDTEKIVVAAYHYRQDIKSQTHTYVSNFLTHHRFKTFTTPDRLVHGWK